MSDSATPDEVHPVIVEEREFTEARDFINALLPWHEEVGAPRYVYRGHKNDSYTLVPSALRSAEYNKLCKAAGMEPVLEEQRDWIFWQTMYEEAAIRRFYRFSDRFGLYLPHVQDIRQDLNDPFQLGNNKGPATSRWLPLDYMEVAGLAQHNGVPTRLLDWSHDPLTAAYFASERDDEAEFLSVWCLCIDALAQEGNLLNGAPIEFITPFYGGNHNLHAQTGLFSHWITARPSARAMALIVHEGSVQIADRRPLDALLKEHFKDGSPHPTPIMRRLRLSSDARTQMRQLLSRAGYGPARLFPGYKGVVAQMLDDTYDL